MNALKRIMPIVFCSIFFIFLNNCKSDDDTSDQIEICDNGIDDDGDGFIDGDDLDCQELCNNGIDDDGDGFIDCDDMDCDGNPDC